MVLIVHAESAVAMAFCRVAGRHGQSAEIEYTLETAKEALVRRAWSGFVVDVWLPDGNGLTFVELLRADRRFEHVPVAVLTADLLIEEEVGLVAERLRAKLYVGILGMSDIEDICSSHLLAPQVE